MRESEPNPPTKVGIAEAEYAGVHYHGEHAHSSAELVYLRDWKAWKESTPVETAPEGDPDTASTGRHRRLRKDHDGASA
jgi:hypothetical protein